MVSLAGAAFIAHDLRQVRKIVQTDRRRLKEFDEQLVKAEETRQRASGRANGGA